MPPSIMCPRLSMLGPQQSGPLGWDTPNRVISWGWLPVPLPQFKKRWDFVYTFDWRTGFPFTSVDDNYQVVGAAGSRRFPNYLAFSPGLEWRFHFRGSYFGLRGVYRKHNRQRKSPGGEQRGGFAPVWNLQRVRGQSLHGAPAADRDKEIAKTGAGGCAPQYAAMPVRCWPRMSVWMSCVPS